MTNEATEFLEAAKPTDRDVVKARKFLESFAYSTTALLAIEAALRAQYADARAEGLLDSDAAPSADILASVIPAFADIEATEV